MSERILDDDDEGGTSVAQQHSFKFDIDDFNMVKVLGSGGYGKVRWQAFIL